MILTIKYIIIARYAEIKLLYVSYMYENATSKSFVMFAQQQPLHSLLFSFSFRFIMLIIIIAIVNILFIIFWRKNNMKTAGSNVYI